MQLQIFLGILADTHNLTLATLNVSSSVPPVSPERPPEGPPEGPEGAPEGPKGPPEGSGVVPGPFEAVGCNEGVLGQAGNAASRGLATATPQMGYDISLFSYVGCRCNAGYDNVYTLTDTGGFLLSLAGPWSLHGVMPWGRPSADFAACMYEASLHGSRHVRATNRQQQCQVCNACYQGLLRLW